MKKPTAKPTATVADASDLVTVRITAAFANPVRVTVNGETVVMRIGDAIAVPAWVIDALTSSDATFEVIDNA